MRLQRRQSSQENKRDFIRNTRSFVTCLGKLTYLIFLMRYSLVSRQITCCSYKNTSYKIFLCTRHAYKTLQDLSSATFSAKKIFTVGNTDYGGNPAVVQMYSSQSPEPSPNRGNDRRTARCLSRSPGSCRWGRNLTDKSFD